MPAFNCSWRPLVSAQADARFPESYISFYTSPPLFDISGKKKERPVTFYKCNYPDCHYIGDKGIYSMKRHFDSVHLKGGKAIIGKRKKLSLPSQDTNTAPELARTAKKRGRKPTSSSIESTESKKDDTMRQGSAGPSHLFTARLGEDAMWNIGVVKPFENTHPSPTCLDTPECFSSGLFDEFECDLTTSLGYLSEGMLMQSTCHNDFDNGVRGEK